MLRAFLAALALTAGSALAHDGPVNEDERTLIKRAKVLVIIDQVKAESAFAGSTSGKDFGLIGMTIDLIDSNSRAKKMNAALAPVQDATSDLNFRRDFVAQLKGLKLFDPTRIEVVEKRPESTSALQKLVADAGDPVVVIDASARLAATNYRLLTVNVTMGLWTANKRKAVHTHRVAYNSEPISLSLAMVQESITLPMWAQNRGRKYRAAYAQGIAGSIDLLVKAFDVAQPAGAKRESRVDYADPNMRSTQYGYVIDETGDRVEMLDGQSLSSLPTLRTYSELAKNMKQVKSNMSRVYFYRPGKSDTNFIDPSVYANDTKLGDVYFSTFVYVDVAPGRYTFRVTHDGDGPGSGLARDKIAKVSPVTIDATAANEYFVRYGGYKGIWTKEDILKSVDPKEAQAELQGLLPMSW